MFAIERKMTGWSDEDIDASIRRAQMCAFFFTEFRWHRSFLDRELQKSTCYYEAKYEADIREHARLADLPCDAVQLVEEVVSDDFAQPTEADARAFVKREPVGGPAGD
jgi:hypothetical protein